MLATDWLCWVTGYTCVCFVWNLYIDSENSTGWESVHKWFDRLCAFFKVWDPMHLVFCAETIRHVMLTRALMTLLLIVHRNCFTVFCWCYTNFLAMFCSMFLMVQWSEHLLSCCNMNCTLLDLFSCTFCVVGQCNTF